MSDSPPVVYGKYQLLEQLARGGMAEVFKAKAHGVEGFEKVLVIKRILPELGENPRFVEMFINEAKIAVTLSHANIVQVFDLGQTAGSYYIAMEYVAGMDLAKVLRLARKAKRRPPAELALFVISELSKGLDYAHRRRDTQGNPLNIIHRDVSPQNVLLSFEGEVKLTDFGIAKARTVAQAVTELGVVKGKYAYMSPEQLAGGALDARTDIFSAGTLLYETLSGVNPFKASSTYDTLQRIRGAEITPLGELVPELSPEVATIVERAMAAKPGDRYATAGDLYEDLIQHLYSSGRRVSARDLGELMRALKAGRTEVASKTASELEHAFEVTHFDEPAPERTRVERGRRGREPNRPVAAGAPVRERAEWRDVTALVVSLPKDEPLGDSVVAHLIERFGGQSIDDVTHADMEERRVLHGLFGAVHPDGRDTENAARAALKLSRAASAAAAEKGGTSEAAIAVQTGRVLVDLSGKLSRDDAYRALFDVGSELAGRAGPSQIIVDAAAERALRTRFRLVGAGAGAEGAHLLATERNLADVYGRFIGRRDVLKRIGEALGRAQQSELRIVGLAGEAGSGKSRLLVETMRRLGLAGQSAALHVATLTPQMRMLPLSAIQEMLRVVLGVDEFDAEALLRDRTTRLRELGLLSSEQAAVGAVLGLSTEHRSEAAAGRRPLRAALLRIIRKLAEDQLTIFAWDGSEHMDDDSLEIMGDMLRAVRAARVAVLLCYRPGHEPRWMGQDSFSEIRLPPMNDDEVAKLVATRLGADEIPFELLREVVTKSGGNPLYVEEYLAALQDAGAVTFEDGQVRHNPDVAHVEVPKTLRGIVSSRIARLSPGQRYALQVASLVGDRFPLDVVAAATGESVRSVAQGMREAERRGLVSTHGPSEHAFSHELVRQVLAESITVQARREIHAAIVDAMLQLFPERVDELAERLARHAHGSGDVGAAVRYHIVAADRFEDEGALDPAIATLQRGVELLVDDPERQDLMLHLYARIADLYFRSRDLLRGAGFLERGIKAAERLKAHGHTARLCMWRGRLLVGASRIEEGRQWLDQAQHVARGLTDWQLSRDVFLATADADARSGEFERAVGLLREALALSRGAEDQGAELRCLLPLALTYARMGDHGSAMETLSQAQNLAESRGDPMLRCRVHRLESQIHYHARNQEESAHAAARAIEVAQHAGLAYESALNAHNMGEAYLRLGDHRRAFAALRSSFEAAAEHGFSRLQMSNMRALGFIDATRFGSLEGRARVAQAIEYAREHDYVWDVIQGKFLLAIIDQRRGEVAASRDALREVLELSARHGHRNYIEDAEAALRQLQSGLPIELPL